MHFADNAVYAISKCIRVTSVAGYEFRSCVLYMLIKHMCIVECGLDLVHVTRHIEYHLHYDRSWYPTFEFYSTTLHVVKGG